MEVHKEDVVTVIRSFCDCNEGDDAKTNLLLAVGAELLDISPDTMAELIAN